MHVTCLVNTCYISYKCMLCIVYMYTVREMSHGVWRQKILFLGDTSSILVYLLYLVFMKNFLQVEERDFSFFFCPSKGQFSFFTKPFLTSPGLFRSFRVWVEWVKGGNFGWGRAFKGRTRVLAACRLSKTCNQSFMEEEGGPPARLY